MAAVFACGAPGDGRCGSVGADDIESGAQFAPQNRYSHLHLVRKRGNTMKDRLTSFKPCRLGLSALAALLFCAWYTTRAEPSEVGQLAQQPTAPRHSDAMPEPPTPTPAPERQEPPRIFGERPGYWQSPEAVDPWDYPYRPGFFPYGGYYHFDLESPPTIDQPPYRPYWNRRWGRIPRYRRWRF